MKKIKFIFIISMTILLTELQMPLFGQNVYWVESAFDSPRLVKTGADGTELLSKSLQAGSLPQNIAINAKDETLFWTELAFVNAQLNTISSDFNSGSVVVDSQSVLRGIAIDLVNNKIYWTSTNLITGPKIWCADMDGKSPTVLLDFGSGSNSTPRAMSLDIKGGKMYWTNFGEGTIQRADLSVGAVPEDILKDLNGPSGLAVDSDSGKVFWTEMNGHQIKSADLNGKNETLLVSDLSYPNSISVNRSKNRMAWTEIGSRKVKSAALDGSDIFDYEVTATAPAGIIIEPSPVSDIRETGSHQLPQKFALKQNYPNPFNPTTSIKFFLPKSEQVKIEVYNALGQRVTSLINRKMFVGSHEVNFNAQDLPSGIYVYLITAGQFRDIKKMVLMR